MATTYIEISDVEFEVDYTVDWGYDATREEPGVPAHICELTVRLADHDVTDVLSARVLNCIEEACFKHAEQDRRDFFIEPDPTFVDEDLPF